MTDLETRLRDVLTDESHAAPDGHGLAEGARRRRRIRRGTRLWTAALVLVIALPVGFAALARATYTSTDDVGSDSSSGSSLRTWTASGVSVSVPASWAEGAVSSWCVGATSPSIAGARVQLPTTGVLDILCTPGTGYGVSIAPPLSLDPPEPGSGWTMTWGAQRYAAPAGGRAVYPDGSWVQIVDEGAMSVTIVTADRRTTETIAASVQADTSGWRTITWRGATLRVPPTWREGGPSAWCVGVRRPEDATPAYELPHTIVPSIGCGRPSIGYGLRVTFPYSVGADRLPAHEYRWVGREASRRLYPDRSWVQTVDFAGGTLTIVTSDRSTTERIASSAR